MVKSWVSFVRKQLEMNGRSQHSGRGSYWCYVDLPMTWGLFKERVERLLPKWQEKGLVANAQITATTIFVEFVEQGGENINVDWYRTFRASADSFGDDIYKRHMYYITFTLPQRMRVDETLLTAA